MQVAGKLRPCKVMELPSQILPNVAGRFFCDHGLDSLSLSELSS